jgi:hypothetical protein
LSGYGSKGTGTPIAGSSLGKPIEGVSCVEYRPHLCLP